MFYRLVLLTFLWAHHSLAGVSELLKSGNGFLYDVPLASDLKFAPLDLANDEKTHLAFRDKSKVLNSYKELKNLPSVVTAVSMQTKLARGKSRVHTSSSYQTHYLSSRSTPKLKVPLATNKKSGYSYSVPLKPFLLR